MVEIVVMKRHLPQIIFSWAARVLTCYEGPGGVKWELGLAGFALGKWGSSYWDWDLVTENGKKC